MASIAKRANSWQVQIRKQGYQTISKSFSKKADADIWARITESEMDRGVFIDRSEAERTTLSEILTRYLREVSIHKLGFKPEQSRINGLLNHPFSSRFLATLKSSDFATYREDRLRLVTGTTVNKELNLIAKIIDTARRDWSINMDNPVRVIRRPKNNQPRDRRLKEGELELILDTTKSEQLSHIILFAIETAMRRGEICKAQWSHLDLSKRILKIPQTKTGVPRTIPLSSKAIEVLLALPNESNSYIFNIQPDSITQAFERACLRANIIDLNYHDLRHESVSRLFELGLSLPEVAAISGHKTWAMLKRYTHLKAEDLAKKLG
jgi:integrase